MKKLIITSLIAGTLTMAATAQVYQGTQSTATRTDGRAENPAPDNITNNSTSARQPGSTNLDATVNTESSNITAESNTAGSNTGATEAIAITTTPAATGTVQTQTSKVTAPSTTSNVTVTAPGRGTGVETVTAPSTITYEQRAEAAYRAATVPQDVVVKLRDYDVKVRDARMANDAALVRQYYSEQAALLTPQQINGITTYLRSNPVTETAAVTVWEDPAYVTTASPATVINPSTVVTREVRTQPVVTRQVQVPVVQGSVPVVVRDPVPVVRTEVSAPATVQVETTPAPVVTTTEEVTTYTHTRINENETTEK